MTLPAPHGASNDSTRRWVAAIVLTAIFCALQVTRSMSVGMLALPTKYDDISYYLTGAEYLQVFFNSGIHGVISTYLGNPPHAPLSTGLVFFGYSLLGVNAWVGPVVNSALFLFFVRWFLSFADGIRLSQAVLVTIAFFGFPFVTLTVMDFRPDMFCSLFVACGMIFIVARRDWLAEWRVQAAAGLLLAAALWSKPTVFHLSVVLFCVAIFLASLGALLRRDFKGPARAALVTLGTGVLLSLPYYGFALGRIVDYIWTTAFGSGASIWVHPLPLRDQVLVYLTGNYGQMSLGAWLYGSIVVGVCALVVLWRTERPLFNRALLVVAAIAITYLAVTIPSFKGPHGYPFAALVFVGAALASVILVRRVPAIYGWGISVALVAFSAWQFAWPSEAIKSDYVESRWSMLHQAKDAMGHDVSGKRFLLTTSAVYLNYSVLAYEYYREGLVPPLSDNTQEVSDLEEQRRRINAADIVFAVTPDFTEIFPHLPTASSEMRTQIIKIIEDSHRFTLKKRIPDPIGGGAALIYVNAVEGFGEFSQTEGLRPQEGPYPQWNLPRVRWGWGSQSRLVAEGAPGTQSRLVLEARTVGMQNQVLTVKVNGKTKAQAALNDNFARLEAIVDFDPQGHADIVLSYAVTSDNAALYKTISIQPLEQEP